jgi:dynein heavy chain, axonemal
MTAVHTRATADPLSLLVDNAMVASWVRQGLPSDPTSVQNGTILTNSERWPLMLDPQLQGVVWIKERESKNNLQVRSTDFKTLHTKNM